MVRRYALDTYTRLEDGPFACRFVAASALCSDGKVRAVRFHSGIADTFFSVPCSVQIRGKTVAGYITQETLEGWSTETEGDPIAVKFIAYRGMKNGELLPEGAWKREERQPIAS